MGITYPCTGDTYFYCTLPMGTRNSSVASDGFMAAFVRHLMETSDLFGVSPVDNSIQQHFSSKISHPQFGEGRVLFDTDGLPEVLL